MSNPQDKDLQARRFLERRLQASVKSKSGGTSRKPILVLAAEFKRLLMKYVQRQIRQNRQFCLVKLEILQYQYLLDTLGSAGANQLHKSVQEILLRNMRDTDRLCPVCPGQFLLLLPDTGSGQAQTAMERICQTISANKSTYRRQSLHASCAFTLADFEESASDIETLLKALGLKLDAEGGFSRGQEPAAYETHAFACALPVWLNRYEGLQKISTSSTPVAHIEVFAATDAWSEQKPVVISMVSPQADQRALEQTQLGELFKRARSLQLLNHPSVLGISDYHLQDGKNLYVVRDSVGLTLLTDVVGGRQIELQALLEWGMQILNALIYLQAMVPPVVPPHLSKCVYLDNASGQVLFADFELPYLLPWWWCEFELKQDEMNAAAQGRPVKAYCLVIESFAEIMQLMLNNCVSAQPKLQELLSALKLSPLPVEFNTIYKIRTAFKDYFDQQKLKGFAGSG